MIEDIRLRNWGELIADGNFGEIWGSKGRRILVRCHRVCCHNSAQSCSEPKSDICEMHLGWNGSRPPCRCD